MGWLPTLFNSIFLVKRLYYTQSRVLKGNQSFKVWNCCGNGKPPVSQWITEASAARVPVGESAWGSHACGVSVPGSRPLRRKQTQVKIYERPWFKMYDCPHKNQRCTVESGKGEERFAVCSFSHTAKGQNPKSSDCEILGSAHCKKMKQDLLKSSHTLIYQILVQPWFISAINRNGHFMNDNVFLWLVIGLKSAILVFLLQLMPQKRISQTWSRRWRWWKSLENTRTSSTCLEPAHKMVR